MSRQLALDTIHLKPTPRLAHTEYSLQYHKSYIREKTGLEPTDPEAIRRLYDLWQIDFLWNVNDGLHGNWAARGRCTDMGHAVYAADGSDHRLPKESPFQRPEDVWSFDPASEYGLPDFAEQVAAYQRNIDSLRQAHPNRLSTGGYYKTIVSGAIQAFGWDAFLEAAANRSKIEAVLERFFRFTHHHMLAWAQTDAEVIIQHDDFVWTEGAFMHPDIYRKTIIPGYAELWKPLKAAGKKVLFCSDGNFTEFAADILAAGADGLIFEPCNPFDWMAERFGDAAVLVGSAVDCREMAFAGWERVKAQMDQTFAAAHRCKGLIWAVGNHLPANIPAAMMDQYLGYLKANWNR